MFKVFFLCDNLCTLRDVGVGRQSPQTSQQFSLLMGKVVDSLLAAAMGLDFPLQNFSWIVRACTVLRTTSHFEHWC